MALFLKNKDAGSWSIPKGEFLNDEDALTAAIREFKEETGFDVDGDFHQLDPVKLKSGKTIHAWALQGEIDVSKVISNTFEIQWPPSSGKLQSFHEVDKGGWFTTTEAKEKINPAQFALIEQLQALIIEPL